MRALWFFEPEEDANLACHILAMADWAEEINRMSTHPIPDILSAPESLYSGPQQAQGQFPLWPSQEESGVMDVQTWSQAIWTYLCAILQYYEDDMVAREGALYDGKVWQPSALVIYIMQHVKPTLMDHYWVEWTSIVGLTPWFAAWDHMSDEELSCFYNQPDPEISSELELAMEDVYHQAVEEAA